MRCMGSMIVNDKLFHKTRDREYKDCMPIISAFICVMTLLHLWMEHSYVDCPGMGTWMGIPGQWSKGDDTCFD